MMVNQNYFGVTANLDPMEIDQSEEQINVASQSDSKLYEGNNKKSDNSDAKHSISEIVTKTQQQKQKHQTQETENESDEEKKNNKGILKKRCVEKTSADTQINNTSCRDPVRAESMIRQTITKMEKHRTVRPGMASARSLTNLISADYGWTPTAVYSKVEKALRSAADHGIIKEMVNKENGQKSYTVPDSKVKKYIKSFYKPTGNSRMLFYKHFSNLMTDE